MCPKDLYRGDLYRIMKHKCIIFDRDGVLVNSEEISTQILTEMARSISVDVKEELSTNEFQVKSLQYLFDYIESKTD
jgi:beta-phosphoglucomutase-like phosphatase (HAD superfamily)